LISAKASSLTRLASSGTGAGDQARRSRGEASAIAYGNAASPQRHDLRRSQKGSTTKKTYEVRTDKSFLLLFLEKEGLLPSRVCGAVPAIRACPQ
jgi:ribosomal protein L25 (general stress protein Ctc)